MANRIEKKEKKCYFIFIFNRRNNFTHVEIQFNTKVFVRYFMNKFT